MGQPVRILSLGAGVQSSYLALRAALGEMPAIDHAIFADTQAEPASVYRWLEWLENEIAKSPHPFPVHRATRGSLTEESLRIRKSKSGNFYQKSSPPLFTSEAGASSGLLTRQCTLDFKIDVIRRTAKKIAGRGQLIEMMIGISADEAHRAKPSRDARIVNCWPLLDERTYRGQCLAWFDARGYPRPPRSSCYFCPYHSNEEWRRLRDEEPEAFAAAVEYEKAIQSTMGQVTGFRGTVWLHRELKPLAEVDLSQSGQQDLWGNECAGICGV